MSFGALTRFGIAMEARLSAPAYPGTPATISTLLPIAPPQPGIERPVTALATAASFGLADHPVYTLPLATLTGTVPVVYHDLEPLWCCALGYMAKRYSDVVFPEEIVSGAYRHRYEVLPSLRSQIWRLDEGWKLDDGLQLDDRHSRRLTLAGTLGDLEAWEWQSAMVQRVRLVGAVGQALSLEVTFLAGNLDEIPATNSLAALQALSVPTQPYVLWHQGETRLAPYSASVALDADDIVAPAAFELTIDTGLVPTSSARSFTTWEEPRQERATRITGAMSFPNLTTTARLFAQRAKTPYMLSLTFTGAEIAATGEDAMLSLYLPRLVLTQPQVIWNGAGLISEGLGFECLIPAQAAAGFPATQRLSPLIVQLVTPSSVHPLE